LKLLTPVEVQQQKKTKKPRVILALSALTGCDSVAATITYRLGKTKAVKVTWQGLTLAQM
jgi:hypothetical protein